MAARESVVARASAQLTGGGATDYAADLDMDDTFDHNVTVTVDGTKGNLASITFEVWAGASSAPTTPVSWGSAVQVENISDATWSRSCTFTQILPYFRVSVKGNGADPTGSDAVITYYYQPRERALVQRFEDGIAVLDRT